MFRGKPMNRRFAVAVLLLTALSLVLFHVAARAAAQAPRGEDQLLKLERDWLDADARGDHAALDRVIADDFIGNGFGNILYKDDVAPANAPAKPAGTKYAVKESSVRLFGETGVVMSTVAVEDPQKPGEFRCTLVFQKRGDVWKMIAAHLSR